MTYANQIVEVAQISIQGTSLIGQNGDEQFVFDLQTNPLRLGFSESSCLFSIEVIDQISLELDRVHILPMDLTGTGQLDTYRFLFQEVPGTGPAVIGIGTVVIEDIGTDPLLGEVRYIFKLNNGQPVELSLSNTTTQALLVYVDHSNAAHAFSMQLIAVPG